MTRPKGFVLILKKGLKTDRARRLVDQIVDERKLPFCDRVFPILIIGDDGNIAIPLRLPDRSKNGTPAHRQLSISARTAAKVSVPEPGATPGSPE